MEILLRDVIESDLLIFYEHQADPEATRMAAFPSRNLDSFMAHWKKILADKSNMIQTIVYDGQVAGNLVSFLMEAKREVGYWLGSEYWGKGIATRALSEFLKLVKNRPKHGVAIIHNIASRRVLENCGFRLLSEQRDEVVYILEWVAKSPRKETSEYPC